MTGSERICNHDADVVAHKISPVDAESIHDTRDITGLRLFIVSAFRLGRQTKSTKIRHYDRVILHQRGRKWPPHISRVAETMQHDDSWALPSNPNVDGDVAANIDIARVKLAGKRKYSVCLLEVTHVSLLLLIVMNSHAFAAPSAPAASVAIHYCVSQAC